MAKASGSNYGVAQHDNGRACTFFSDADYALCRDLLAQHCRAAKVAVWACARHRRYAGIIHARRKRTGHFWQGRFGAVAKDEPHRAAALRYVTQNTRPVCFGLPIVPGPC